MKYKLLKDLPRTGENIGIVIDTMKNPTPAETGSSSIWNEGALEKSLEGQRGTGAKHSKRCWINELGSGL